MVSEVKQRWYSDNKETQEYVFLYSILTISISVADMPCFPNITLCKGYKNP